LDQRSPATRLATTLAKLEAPLVAVPRAAIVPSETAEVLEAPERRAPAEAARRRAERTRGGAAAATASPVEQARSAAWVVTVVTVPPVPPARRWMGDLPVLDSGATVARTVEPTPVRQALVTGALAETDLWAPVVMPRAMTPGAAPRKVAEVPKQAPATARKAVTIQTQRALVVPARATPAR
jgi:hypothetical protein